MEMEPLNVSLLVIKMRMARSKHDFQLVMILGSVASADLKHMVCG